MAICAKFRIPVVTAAVLFGGVSPILADIVLQADNDADKKTFGAMVDACASKSPAFSALVKGRSNPSLKDKSPQGGIDQDAKNHIDIRLVRTGDFIDDAESRGGGGNITVNLANLQRLPNPDFVGGKFAPPPKPPWAMTQCESMAHFLKEADVMAKDPGKPKSPEGNPHNRGIDAQNGVRKDFKQFAQDPCRKALLPNFGNDKNGDQVPPKRITYTDANGKPQKTTPPNQVLENYGGQHTEVLWFDDQHRLQMAFFEGPKQMRREDLTLPGDQPGKPNPDYVYGPSKSEAGTLALNGDCTDGGSAPAPVAPPKGECSSGTGLEGAINGVTCQIQKS